MDDHHLGSMVVGVHPKIDPKKTLELGGPFYTLHKLHTKPTPLSPHKTWDNGFH